MDDDTGSTDPRNTSPSTGTPPARQSGAAAAKRAQLAVAAEKLTTEARAALAGFKQPSPKTLVVYLRIFRRILAGKSLSAFATSKSTYYQARAAFVCCCSIGLRNAIVELEAALAAGDWPGALQQTLRVRSLIDDLKRYPPDRERQRCHDEDHFGDYRQLAGDRPRVKPHSKRRGLASLPADWRSQVVGTANQAHSKYALPIAVQLITGCRPAEVEGGVLVKLAADGGLIFRIVGAKVIAGVQGQEWRELVVPDDGQYEVQFVKAAITRAESAGTVKADGALAVQARAKGLGWAVGYYGEAASTPWLSARPPKPRPPKPRPPGTGVDARLVTVPPVAGPAATSGRRPARLAFGLAMSGARDRYRPRDPANACAGVHDLRFRILVIAIAATSCRPRCRCDSILFRVDARIATGKQDRVGDSEQYTG